MLKRKKPLLRKTPIKRSKQPIKRTAIKKSSTPIKKKSSNGLPKILDKTERLVHLKIKERDRDGDYFVCIACGKTKHVEEMQAGHFFSKTYAATRYHEDNIHGECSTCNCSDTNHLIGYEIRLIEKIGTAKFEALKVLKNQIVHWDRELLESIIEKYSKCII